MWKTLRRLFWLSALGGGGYAAFNWYQQRNDALAPPQSPEWPPLDGAQAAAGSTTARPEADQPVADKPATEESAAKESPTTDPAAAQGLAAVGAVETEDSAAAAEPTSAPTGDQRWVEPVDGECPDGYPIKANANSGIYHVPGGRFYGRTVPERCYARAEDAEADGYRAAKA